MKVTSAQPWGGAQPKPLPRLSASGTRETRENGLTRRRTTSPKGIPKEEQLPCDRSCEARGSACVAAANESGELESILPGLQERCQWREITSGSEKLTLLHDHETLGQDALAEPEPDALALQPTEPDAEPDACHPSPVQNEGTVSPEGALHPTVGAHQVHLLAAPQSQAAPVNVSDAAAFPALA